MKSSEFYEGREGLPAVLLIHGLGMNKYFWIDPEECSVLGGLAPLTVFLSGSDAESTGRTISFGTVDPDIEGLWRFLKKAGFSLASWSQSQPLGPIRLAVDELRAFLEKVRSRWPGKTIYIIGHSRGGLIARRFLLDEAAPHIAGLATICTPHSGTGPGRRHRDRPHRSASPRGVLPRGRPASRPRCASRRRGRTGIRR